MSLECYKGKGGSSLYYNEGKRISKAKAKLLGTKLPKCVSKTNQSRMIKIGGKTSTQNIFFVSWESL
jgi:hypothetical protein